MSVPVTTKDGKGFESGGLADSVPIEAGHFSCAYQIAKNSVPEASWSCCKSHPAHSRGEKPIVTADVVNVPTSPVDPSSSSEPMTCHELDRRVSDEDLISRILSGDELALGAAYDRYGRLLHSVARHILQDSGAVDEVVQDTFYQLWRVAGSFDSARGTLGCWLLVIARNRSIDRLRRRTPAMEEEVAATLLGSVLDIESFVASNEMAGRVRAAVRVLPEVQRLAVELAYFEGFTQSEIAKRTGEPLGTVKTRLRTALASLKAHFDE
jgi:RNA polymerase sigma-70 factor, ECF subfamily